MCAIFGLGLMKGHTLKEETILQNIVRTLFIQSKARGSHASGLAVTNAYEIGVIKTNVAATEFINLPEYKDMERTYINSVGDPAHWPTISVLGHCRHQTKGTSLDNTNNHPIVRDKVVGIHNGMIGNDDDIFRVYRATFDRNGLVDSEAIFALMEHFSALSGGTVNAIQRLAKSLSGSFACAAVHRDQPHLIWLFRRSNPCVVALFKKVGLVMWASAEAYINEATHTYYSTLGPGEIIEYPVNSCMCIDLHRNMQFKFDLPIYKGASNSLSSGGVY
jgi:glucosamine 6-phosphate synthetase-like amidotransferase/phosphosugar isomerase protein